MELYLTAVAGPMNITIRPCHFKTVLVTETANAVDLHLLQLLVLTFLKQGKIKGK